MDGTKNREELKMSETVCAVSFPMTMGGSPMALCTLAPKHKGSHRCMIDYTWPQSTIIVDGGVVLTSRFRVSKERERYINLAYEKASKKQAHP